MTDWPIRDVSRATGITSRTLRHYEQIGLLRPARVAPNGYRFYGDEEISRLYRILSLRSLGLPLASIGSALEDDATLAGAITAHLALLEERRERTAQQITAVQHTLAALTTGDTMTIEDIFAGFDAARHEGEVRERWGEDAWRRSTARRSRMSEDERRADDRRSRDVTAALRDAAASGEDPAGARFQDLIATHHAWVADQWGGRAPDRDSYTGLSELYVADPRFAAAYGGQASAELIRDAMQMWIAESLG